MSKDMNKVVMNKKRYEGFGELSKTIFKMVLDGVSDEDIAKNLKVPLTQVKNLRAIAGLKRSWATDITKDWEKYI